MKAHRGLILTAVMTGICMGAEKVPKDQPVKVDQAVVKIAAGNQLLDVRTREEWNEGHLKGAKLVTVSEEGFAAKAKAVLDPGKPVVVYCRSGVRSAAAAKLLREAGFIAVFDMAGGITAWKEQGKPVVK